jgi:hypothetical protein
MPEATLPLSRSQANWQGLLVPGICLLASECLGQFRRFDTLFRHADHRCRLVYGPQLMHDIPLEQVATQQVAMPRIACDDNGQNQELDRVFIRYKTRSLRARPSEFGLYEEVGVHLLRIHYEVRYHTTTGLGKVTEQRYSFPYSELLTNEFCTSVARQLWRNLAALLELNASTAPV